jgi:Mrp family chromosome partitioning ATPase
VLVGRANGQTARGTLTLQSAAELIGRAATCYEYVVIDSPPVLGAADSLFWAHAVDGIILTSMVGHSDRKAIRLACQRLTAMGGRLLGSVIANVSHSEAYYSCSAGSVSSDRSHGKDAAKRVPPLVYLSGETPEGPTKQD